jgi:hypothetical protein
MSNQNISREHASKQMLFYYRQSVKWECDKRTLKLNQFIDIMNIYVYELNILNAGGIDKFRDSMNDGTIIESIRRKDNKYNNGFLQHQVSIGIEIRKKIIDLENLYPGLTSELLPQIMSITV